MWTCGRESRYKSGGGGGGEEEVEMVDGEKVKGEVQGEVQEEVEEVEEELVEEMETEMRRGRVKERESRTRSKECMLTSVMAQSDRMALGRYWSSFPVMSLVRLSSERDRGSHRPTKSCSNTKKDTPAGHYDDVISNSGHFSDGQVHQSAECHLCTHTEEENN